MADCVCRASCLVHPGAGDSDWQGNKLPSGLRSPPNLFHSWLPYRLDIACSHSLLPCVQAISAEEGCTATAVLMWRDGQGDVCLQVCGAGRLGSSGKPCYVVCGQACPVVLGLHMHA